MTMTPSARKVVLTAHITSSVGWLGVVLGFLALALTGLASRDERVVRGVYVSMHVMTWWAIVPLSSLSFATGLLASLGTPWGLVRHYWVLVKLGLTLITIPLLILHTRPIGWMAQAALRVTPIAEALMSLRAQLVFDAAAAAVVLLVATVLSVYKPRGLTPYGSENGGGTK
jgi:hypothetical protein